MFLNIERHLSKSHFDLAVYEIQGVNRVGVNSIIYGIHPGGTKELVIVRAVVRKVLFLN